MAMLMSPSPIWLAEASNFCPRPRLGTALRPTTELKRQVPQPYTLLLEAAKVTGHGFNSGSFAVHLHLCVHR